MYNEQVPDFIRNLGSKSANATDPVLNNTSSEAVPDFIKNMNQNKWEQEEIQRQINLKDQEVGRELGVQLNKDWALDESKVKSYIDGLSDEDYDTWSNLREQWYSLEARKALMDNKDLLWDPTKEGSAKYLANTPVLPEWLINWIQRNNTSYEETIHPWSVKIQNALNSANQYVSEKLDKETLMNNWIDKNNPYGEWQNRITENTLNNYERYVNLLQIPKTATNIILSTLSKGTNALDQLINRKNIIMWEWANLIQKIAGRNDVIDLDYSKRSNFLGSNFQLLADWLWIGLVAEFPLATYFLGQVWNTSETAEDIMSVIEWWFDKTARWLLRNETVENLLDVAWLNEEDKEKGVEALAQALFIATSYLLHRGGKRVTQTELIRDFNKATEIANEFGKEGWKRSMQENYNMKELVGTQPEGTEVLNKKGKTIARSVWGKGEFTPEWSIDTAISWVKWYAEWFKNAWTWYMKNRGKQLVTRNPNAPVWELPIMDTAWWAVWSEAVKPDDVTMEEPEAKDLDKPYQETDEFITDKAKPKEKVKTEKPIETTEKTVKKSPSVIDNLVSFIKDVSEEFTGKKWWLSEELVEKLKTNPDLQNEYINTISPYLEANGQANPAWVIKQSIESFTDKVIDQLKARVIAQTKMDTMNNQYKPNTPKSEQRNSEIEKTKLRDLIKVISKNFNDPEKYLNYLLKLPKEKVQVIEKYIPDFSKNLGLIKDTFELTKAISSEDVIQKYLKYKWKFSITWKWLIKRFIYNKLSKIYWKKGMEVNMKKVEEIINNLSPEDLEQFIKDPEGEAANMLLKNEFLTRATDWRNINSIKNGYGDLVPKSWIADELLGQWYRFENSNRWDLDREWNVMKDARNNEDLLNQTFADGTSIRDWKDTWWLLIESNPYLDRNVAWKSLENKKTIQYRQDMRSANAWTIWHEILHQVKKNLTTEELFDLYNDIINSTKSLKKYDENLGISDYKSLARSGVWIEEYIADSFANVLYYGDINSLAGYVSDTIKDLGLKEKTQKIFENISKDLWDNLSSFETENWPTNITNEIKKLIDRSKYDKEFINRNWKWYEPPTPSSNQSRTIAQPWYKARLQHLQTVEPNLVKYKYDLDLDSPNFGNMIFEMKNWENLSWKEFKNSLTPEQRAKLKDDPILKKEGSSELSDQTEEAVKNSIMEQTKELDEYRKILKEQNPDIVSLEMRDGELYATILEESFWERYELADRPGQIELKTDKVKEFLTDEQIENLPKELQDLIKNQKRQSDEILEKLQQEEWK